MIKQLREIIIKKDNKHQQHKKVTRNNKKKTKAFKKEKVMENGCLCTVSA